jgi:hypothetical protein
MMIERDRKSSGSRSSANAPFSEWRATPAFRSRDSMLILFGETLSLKRGI